MGCASTPLRVSRASTLTQVAEPIKGLRRLIFTANSTVAWQIKALLMGWLSLHQCLILPQALGLLWHIHANAPKLGNATKHKYWATQSVLIYTLLSSITSWDTTMPGSQTSLEHWQFSMLAWSELDWCSKLVYLKTLEYCIYDIQQPQSHSNQ